MRTGWGRGGSIVALWIALALAGTSRAQDLRPPQIGPTARAQIQAVIAEKVSRTPAQKKIDSNLLRAIDVARPAPRFPVLHGLARPQPDERGRVVVDIDVRAGASLAPVLAALRASAAEIRFVSERFHAVRAAVPVAMLEDIAALPAVRFVHKEQTPRLNKLTTSEADVTHAVDVARATFGYTGNGQKLCALSNGVVGLSSRQSTGDLPKIDVLPGQGGWGNEGTAMLEIMYDLAPGARFGFATAFNGLAGFAQNILDLADPAQGGCTIIVDDVSYSEESIYQDSIVAQAVDAVQAQGVMYFSSAGNQGALDAGTSGTWEGTFNDAGGLTDPLFPGHVLHEFAPGVTQNVVTQPAQAFTALWWAEPNGAATADYDLYALSADGSALVGYSTNVQSGTQDPHEEFGGALQAGQRLIVAKQASAANRALWVQSYRGVLTYATAGATGGHSAATGAINVAATPARFAYLGGPSGPYPGTFSGASLLENFSSDGPRRVFFAGDGSLLPGALAGDFSVAGGIVRAKPDLTAADGVATSTPGFAEFFGTSAAAPHAAAIAAVVRQAFPAWTPAQVAGALATSAIDIGASGWDRNSGAGIVMPMPVLQANQAPVVARLEPFGPPIALEAHGNGDGFIEDGEDWQLVVPLANDGPVAATGISATLVSDTTGVVVTSGPTPYADLPVNGVVAPASAFRFSVLGLACAATTIRFTLSVATAEHPAPLVFAIELSRPTDLGPAQTFSYTGPSVPIADGEGGVYGPTASASLPVGGLVGITGDVKLRIDGLNGCSPNTAANAGLDHTSVGDLRVSLRAPDDSLVDVITHVGGGPTKGPNFCDVTLDDASFGEVIDTALDGSAPFTGSWRPSRALAAFNGVAPNGTWRLEAKDAYLFDTGNINRFSLILSPLVCTSVPGTVAIAAVKTVTGSFVPSGTVTYTVTLINYGNRIQADNPGDEYVDVLPAALTPVVASSSATSGTLAVDGNTVRWNGALDVGGSTVLTIVATISPFASGQVIASQGTVAYDATHHGQNDATVLTDDPGIAGASDPTAFAVAGPLVTLDVDDDGVIAAETDGLLVMRHLLGETGDVLTADALGANAQRGQPDAIASYLSGLPWQLDIDGDGAHDALTDGLLIVRFLRGLRGSALVEGVIAGGATRTPAQIEKLLQVLAP